MTGGYLLDETRTNLVTFADLLEHPAEWQAIQDWCLFHDMDPNQMPVNNAITRNVEACRVEYDEYVVDADGRKVFEMHPAWTNGVFKTRRAYSQGEAPPLPFPAILHPALDQGDQPA